MKALIKKAVKGVFSLIPPKNTVIFESVPDLSDNTRAVFDEMVRRGINEKYELVWILHKEPAGKLPEIPNVSYIRSSDRIRLKLKRLMAKCVICCNDWIPTVRKGQTTFYLSHGTTIKGLAHYRSPLIDDIDYVLSAADDVAGLCVRELGAKEEQIFSLGFPRNDVLLSSSVDMKALFPDKDFEKVIVWYPTYRQNANSGSVSGGNSLPIIHDASMAEKLNEYAKEKKTLLVLKPHFVQDVSYVKDLGLDNILFIDDAFFAKNGITSYEFVGSCDALITDYSSIYYDYTLCNRPIALIWEDYEEYKKSPGFAEGTEEFLRGGEKVYTLEELCAFVGNVSAGVDVLYEERNRICPMVNCNADANSSKRVVDFIIEKAGL